MSKWLFPPQNDKGCWWYCDECGALLNAQPGFTTESDEWTCADCGAENDVSYSNIRED
ncbi:MAG: hypothetical protein ACI4FO_00445 [Acutalibacteraceae bacterium]